MSESLLKGEFPMLQGLGCFRFSASGFCIVALCHGKDEGRDFHAFVAIEPQNYRYFQKRYRPGVSASFRAFGYELTRGWGTEPADGIVEHLAAQHGIEFGIGENFVSHLIANMPSVSTPLGRQFPAAGITVRTESAGH
jgi:hypothetical protein